MPVFLSLPAFRGVGGSTGQSREQAICKVQKGGTTLLQGGQIAGAGALKQKPICKHIFTGAKNAAMAFLGNLGLLLFSQWSIELFFFIGLGKNIPPSQHTFKQTTNSELSVQSPLQRQLFHS